MVTSTKEITTLENEIQRHRDIADLMRQFAVLADDPSIFTPTTIAAIHTQTASRLMQLKQKATGQT